MALSAYELLLVVRAQNYASNTLRSVSRDLRGMGAATGVAANSAQRLTAARWDRLVAAGSIMRDVGRTARLFGLGLGGALAYASVKAAEFDSQIALVATQTGHASRSISANANDIARNGEIIGRAVLKQMHQFPASAEEMTQAAYDIYSSLNVSLKGGVKLLEVFNKAAVGGMVDVKDATQAGITVLNDFFSNSIDPAASMTKAFQRMFAAVRFGRSTFAEFTQMLPQAAPAAKAAGQSLDNMSASLAFLTRRIPNTRMAATAYARLLETLGKQNFVDGMKRAGAEIVDLHGRLKPLDEVISIIAKRFPELQKGGVALQNFFKTITANEKGKGGETGRIQARRAFTFLITDLKNYREMIKLVTTDNTEFDRSFAALSKSSGVRWKVFLNNIKADIISFGKTAISTIEGLYEPIKRAMNWFDRLDDSTKRSIGKWAVYAAAGLLLGGSILSLAGGIVNLIGILGRFGILGGSILGLFVRLGGVILAAEVILGHFGHNVDLVSAALKGLKAVFTGFFNFTTSGWQQFAIGAGLATLWIGRIAASRKRLLQATAADAAIAGGATRAGAASAASKVGTYGILGAMFFGPAGLSKFSAAIRRAGGIARTEQAIVASAETLAIQRKAMALGNINKAVKAGSITQRAAVREIENAALTTRRASNFTAKWAGESLAVRKSASRIPGILKLAGTAAILLPGPLKVAAGALATIGAGALLWKLRSDAIKRRLEEIRHEYELIASAQAQAKRFGGFGLDVRNLARAKLEVRIIKHELVALQKEIKKATPSGKVALRDQLEGLKLDLADALDVLAGGKGAFRQGFQAVSKFGNIYTKIIQNVGVESLKLNDLIKKRNDLLSRFPGLDKATGFTGSKGHVMWGVLQAINEEILKQRKYVINLTKDSKTPLAEYTKNFNSVLRTLQNAQIIPKIRAPKGMSPADKAKFVANVKTELQNAVLLLRGATQNQLKLLVQAELDPKARQKLPAQLRNALAQAHKERIKVDVEVQAKLSKQQKALAGKKSTILDALGLLPSAIGDPFAELVKKARVAHKNIKKASTPITQRIKLQQPTNPTAFELGARILSDITRGAGGGSAAVHIAAIVDVFKQTHKEVQNFHDSHSPSKLYAKEGKNVAQGFSVGLLESVGLLQKSAVFAVSQMFDAAQNQADISITLFAGEYLSKLEERIKPLTLIQQGRLQDLQAKAAAGKKLSNAQLAAMKQLEQRKSGKLKPIDLIKDIQGQLNALRQFNSALNTLSKRGAPRELLDQLRALGVDGVKYIDHLAKMSGPQLRLFVTNFKSAQAEIKKANQQTLEDFQRGLDGSNKQMSQFLNAMAKLKKRGAPQEVIDFFNQQGIDGINMLLALAKATPAEFDKMVKSIMRGYKLIARSAVASAEEQKQAQKDAMTQATQIAHDKLLEIQHMYQNFMGELFSNLIRLPSLVGAFGDPFSGLSELLSKRQSEMQDAADKAAQAQNDANAAAQKALDDARKAQEDALAKQKALDDAWQSEFDRLSGSFGQLFEGPIAKNLEGFCLTIDILTKDLQAQIDTFKAWRGSLASLASRGVPQALLDQLEQLGPDAAKNIKVLADASDTDLAKYISTWTEAQSLIKKSIDPQKVAAEASKSLADSSNQLADSASIVAETIGELSPTIADLTQVIKEQQNTLLQWSADLLTLVQRGAPKELMQQLIDLGPQAAAAIHLLATSSDADLSSWIDTWQTTADALSSAQDQILNSVDPQAILDSLDEQNKAFESWQGNLATVKQHLIDNGFSKKDVNDIIGELQGLGPDAAQAIATISTMSDPQLQAFVTLWKTRQAEITEATKGEFATQIQMWRNHGQNIAIALVQGVQDEQSLLENWFTNLFKSLLGNFAAGLPQLNTGPSRPPDIADIASGLKNNSGNSQTIHMNITTTSPENFNDAISKATFKMRQIE